MDFDQGAAPAVFVECEFVLSTKARFSAQSVIQTDGFGVATSAKP